MTMENKLTKLIHRRGSRNEPDVDVAPQKPNLGYCYGITNREWLPLKALYFFRNGALGALMPYLVAYYRSRQLTSSQIGTAELFGTFAGALSRPILGSIADKTGKHRLVLCLSFIFFSIFFFSFVFIRPPPSTTAATNTGNQSNTSLSQALSEHRLTIACSPESLLFKFNDLCANSSMNCQISCLTAQSYFSVTPPQSNLTCWLNVSISLPNNNCSYFLKNIDNICHMSCGYSTNVDQLWLTTFLPIFFLRLIGSLPFAVTLSLTDSVAYDVLGVAGQDYWGAQRLFGVISSAAVSGVLGFAIDFFNDDAYDSVFVVLAAFNIAAAMTAMFWLHGSHQSAQKIVVVGYWATLRSAIGNPLFVVACVVATLSGWLMGVLSVVWAQWVLSLGAPKLLLGMSALCASLLEIPGFFFAGSMAKRIGDIGCFLVMFASFAVRFLALAFLTADLVWLAVPLEGLNLFCFATFIASLTRFGASISSQGSSATIQAILQTFYFSIGVGFGGISSSAMYEHLGGRTTFLFYSGISAACCLMLALLHVFCIEKILVKKSNHKNNSQSQEYMKCGDGQTEDTDNNKEAEDIH